MTKSLLTEEQKKLRDLIIEHEYYQEVPRPRPGVRDVEADAAAADTIEEKEC